MSGGNRIRHTVRLPSRLSRNLADHAARRRCSQAAVVEAALVSYLSPEGPDQFGAAFVRRLDRISGQLQKLDYHVEIGNEAFALFLRRWLAVTLPPGDGTTAAMRAEVERRFENFVEALSRRVQAGQRLSDDLVLAESGSSKE